jgi:RHS repeat-associated protein
LDSGTGLYYYGARYYDPLIGRFISADTAAPDPYNPQSRNKYSYCFNNPLKYVDPSGNWPKFLDDAVSWVADKVEVVTEAVGTFVTENIDTIQTGLDIAGMIPVVGEAFDAVNGAIYAARGDYLNAGLSFASCIPVAGTVVGAVAIGVKGVIKGADALSTVVKTTKKVSSFVKLENGYDTFRQAKKAFIDINGPIKKGNEVHHIVEQAQVSSKYAGFNPKLVNNTDNLKSIDKATHRKVTGYYNSKQNFTSDQTVRKWLSTQSFDAQYEYGKSILAMYGHY